MLSEKVFKNGYGVSEGSKKSKGERNDCFVRACSNAFEISYDLSHEFVTKQFGRKRGRGTKNVRPELKEIEIVSFKPEGQMNLFTDNGGKSFRIIHIGDNEKTGDGKLMNQKSSTNTVSYTVKTFMQRFTTGTYILLVKKHALVCKNGVIIDNKDMQFNGYRRPIESAFKVEEIY